MNSTVIKLVKLFLLGGLTLFACSMTAAGLERTVYPAFMTALWSVFAVSMSVSFVVTAYATLKNINTTTIPWHEKVVYLPWSLLIGFIILAGVNTALELLQPLFS